MDQAVELGNRWASSLVQPLLAAVFQVDTARFELWARENMSILIIVGLLIAAMLIVRVVVHAFTRTLALAVVTLMAVFVTAERASISECSQRCDCNLAGVHVDVPYCREPYERAS